TSPILGNVGEFVGAIAVVITLLYLAVQVRQSKEATEINTRSLRSIARIEAGKNWWEDAVRLALSPDMASIVAAGFEDASRLNDNERERLIPWYMQHFFMKDTLHQQYLEGVLPEDVWKAHELVTIGCIQCDSFMRVWDAGFIPATAEFKEYIEQLRKENPPSTWTFANKARIFDDPDD
ncbi:MAG: hypothetical protein ACU84Q_01535, partial [Gammaproteobacteria bacterium]